jgi:hypothetical protein
MTIKELILWQTVYATGMIWPMPEATSTTSSTPATLPDCIGATKTSDCKCPNWDTQDANGNPTGGCIVNKEGTLGISCSADQLINNTCSRNINKTLGIRSSDPNPSPTLLLQDVTLAATSFIGTIIMVAMVWIGINAVMKWSGDEDAMSTAKEKIRNLAIWLLLVISSYTIIRLVQYIARGY